MKGFAAEDLRDQPHAFVRVELLPVRGDDSGALLAAMLESVKAIVRQFGGVRMPVNAEDSAIMFGVLLHLFPIIIPRFAGHFQKPVRAGNFSARSLFPEERLTSSSVRRSTCTKRYLGMKIAPFAALWCLKVIIHEPNYSFSGKLDNC